MTGAITNVDIKQLNAPGANLSNALAGVVPGIIAMQTSGEPGENMSEFWIRGMSTFGAKSGALILVDGVERSFNEIPVEDIESFSVLKDASQLPLRTTWMQMVLFLITYQTWMKRESED